MMRHTAVVAAALALGTASVGFTPASAALKQHIYCGVIQLVLPQILVQPPPVATLSMRNTLSRTIAAGTNYTYVVNGQTSSYHSSSALAPGDHISFQITYNAALPSTYDCDAWVPAVLITKVPIATIGKLKVN